MAAKEMYDYLSNVTPDYTTALNIKPSGTIKEIGFMNQQVDVYDDGSETRISWDNDPIFHVEIEWQYLSEADCGTVIDHYYAVAKGNGRARTIRWTHPTDGHDYCVRFDCDMPRNISQPEIYSIPPIRFKVLGYYTPA